MRWFTLTMLSLLTISAVGWAVRSPSADAKGPASSARAADTLAWANRTWRVKSGSAVGPGPNNWSSGPECVRVDEQGDLHLAISPREGSWDCAEIYSPGALGYGEYRWVVAGDLPALAPRTVLGLFLYEDDTHEIDFELSQWGQTDAPNAQFAVQPYAKDSLHRFPTGKANVLTCSLLWSATKVHFRCWAGTDTTHKPLNEWTYAGQKVPKTGKEHVHLNFWLMDGKPDPKATRQEVIIRSFEFSKAEGDPPASRPSGPKSN